MMLSKLMCFSLQWKVVQQRTLVVDVNFLPLTITQTWCGQHLLSFQVNITKFSWVSTKHWLWSADTLLNPLLTLLLTRTGPLLIPYCPFTDPLLTLLLTPTDWYWPFTDPLLTLYWCPTDHPTHLYWPLTDSLLPLYWPPIDPLLTLLLTGTGLLLIPTDPLLTP